MTCRDGREVNGSLRGGARLAEKALTRLEAQTTTPVNLRGIHCMSQCKRPCVATLSAHGKFTYSFGDLDPDNPDHIDALLDMATRYVTATEGFLERKERPEALQATILGRFPPVESRSTLITHFTLENVT